MSNDRNSIFGRGFLPGQVRVPSSSAIRAFEHAWADRPAEAKEAPVAKRPIPHAAAEGDPSSIRI